MPGAAAAGPGTTARPGAERGLSLGAVDREASLGVAGGAKLGFLKLRELRLAGLLLPGVRGGSVKRERRPLESGRCCGGLGFLDTAVTAGAGGESVACAGAVTLAGSVAVPAIIAPSGAGTVAPATAGAEVLAAAASRAGAMARPGIVTCCRRRRLNCAWSLRSKYGCRPS